MASDNHEPDRPSTNGLRRSNGLQQNGANFPVEVVDLTELTSSGASSPVLGGDQPRPLIAAESVSKVRTPTLKTTQEGPRIVTKELKNNLDTMGSRKEIRSDESALRYGPPLAALERTLPLVINQRKKIASPDSSDTSEWSNSQGDAAQSASLDTKNPISTLTPINKSFSRAPLHELKSSTPSVSDTKSARIQSNISANIPAFKTPQRAMSLVTAESQSKPNSHNGSSAAIERPSTSCQTGLARPATQSSNGHARIHTFDPAGSQSTVRSTTDSGSRRVPKRRGSILQSPRGITTFSPVDSAKNRIQVKVAQEPKRTSARRVMTISVPDFEENLQSHLTRMRDDNEYFAKNKLREAREGREGIPKKFIQAGNPFEGLKSIKIDQNHRYWTHINSHKSKSSLKIVIGKMGHWVKGARDTNQLGSYEVTSFNQKATRIPPYTMYISAKRNILTEDDIEKTFLPYQGDDFQLGDNDKEYKALEAKIEANAKRYRRLNHLNDQGRMHRSYTEIFLAEIGCSQEAVLKFLLDEESETRLKANDSTVLAKLSKHASFWTLRKSYLTEGYYEEDREEASAEQSLTEQPREQWLQLFLQLPVIEDEELAIACIACKVFMDVTGFSIFHVVQNYVPNVELIADYHSLGTYADLACFICQSHECPGHGEYRDNIHGRNVRERVNYRPASPSEDISPNYRINDDNLEALLGLDEAGEVKGSPWTTFRDTSSAGFTDTGLCSEECFWKKHTRTNKMSQWSKSDIETFNMVRPAYEFDLRGPCMIAQCGVIKKTCKEIFLRLLTEPTTQNPYSLKISNEQNLVNMKMPPRKTLDQWLDNPNAKSWLQDQREPFLPCDHAGPCSEETQCSCFLEGVHCEKSCACPDLCTNRFQGCHCHAKGRPCKTDKCECRRLNRECDPDLCTSCGVDDVLDPINRHDDEAIVGKCTNATVQRGVPRRTLLGPSKLMAQGGKSGWGLYMGEECKRGDFIGEYRGEIISGEEAEERGTIYDKRGLSYLFALNLVQTLDSTLIGNKLRFINHQADPWDNCQAKLLFCNGVVRIGLFAKKDIAVSEEIFFNYGPNFASKFDLIKMNLDGTVTVEPPSKRAKVKEASKRSLVEHAIATRSPFASYQLKNRLSKNGRRVGRPPKPSSLARQASSTSTVTSQHRQASEISTVRSHKKRQRSDSIEADIGGRKRLLSPFGFTPLPLLAIRSMEDDEEDDRVRRSKRRRLLMSAVVTNLDLDSTPNLKQDSTSVKRETPTRAKSIQSANSSQIELGTPHRAKQESSLLQGETSSMSQAIELQQKQEPGSATDLYRAPNEQDTEDVEEEEDGEDLTPRRSNRRRLEKLHFDEVSPAIAVSSTNSATSPTRPKRTARKEARYIS